LKVFQQRYSDSVPQDGDDPLSFAVEILALKPGKAIALPESSRHRQSPLFLLQPNGLATTAKLLVAKPFIMYRR